MTIWVPLVLLVMPMSIGIGSVMFVIAAMSTISLTGLYIGRPYPIDPSRMDHPAPTVAPAVVSAGPTDVAV